MICVYDIGNDAYEKNGDAVLMPTECRIRNTAGGSYELTMTHPIDPDGKWAHLVPGAVIRAPIPEEKIDNAYAGYEADVYKTNTEAKLREGPSEPQTITYPTWSQYNTYSVGSKVTFENKNYKCVYWDGNSIYRGDSPPNSEWWEKIARTSGGAAVLITLAAGTDLYFEEDVDGTWYKMSTYYGIVGYIKKSQVTYDRHLTPSQTTARVIKEQLFRIEKPTVDTKTRQVSVTATHVSYDLSGIMIQEVQLRQAPPALAMGRIVEGFMMTYRGNIATNLSANSSSGTYTGTIKGKNGIYALLDPDSGIVSRFKAAYKRDNWDLFVMENTVTDRGFRLQYRKNMLGVNWAKDSSGIVTRIVPVAKAENGGDLYLPEKWVDSPLISNYPVIRMERLSVAGQVGKTKAENESETWTESDLLAEMRTKANERYSVDKCDQVAVTVTVEFEPMGATEEYKAIMKGLEKVLLYDRVTVTNEEIGLSVQLYVTEWEWDAIREKITALKLSNTTDYKKGSVTGYNIQSKSISGEKLMDEVKDDIISQVVDIVPEYADPGAKRPSSDGIPATEKGVANGVATLDANGKVTASQLPDNGTAIAKNDDLNTYKTPGEYYSTGQTISSTLSNIPSSASTQMFVLRVENDGTNVFQILTYCTEYVANIFIRKTTGNGANWSTWINATPTPVQNLTTQTTGSPLDASQGYALKNLIDTTRTYETYKSAEALTGVTSGSCTMLGVWNALPNGGMAIFQVSELTAAEQPYAYGTVIVVKVNNARGYIRMISKDGKHEWWMGLGRSAYNGNTDNAPTGEWTKYTETYRYESETTGATFTHDFLADGPFLVMTYRYDTSQTGAYGFWTGYAGGTTPQLVPVMAPTAGVTLSISGTTLTCTTSAVKAGMVVTEL